MKCTGILSIALSVSVAALFTLSCAEGPTTVADAGNPQFHHKPGHAGGPGGGGDDGGGGGGEGPITVVFPDDLAYGGFGIASTGSGGQDLTGENTADGFTAEGSYSLRYVTSDCPAADHPLVDLFNDVELNSPRVDFRMDKEADETGSFEFNDRIRIDLNDLTNPNGDDGFKYSVWFRGKGNPEYDPATDVQITESTDWTSVKVTDEDIFVRKLRCRNKKCKSVEVVEGDVCELAANYSLKVSK